MKKIVEKIGGAMARCALLVTKANVNSTCMFTIHQPKLPKSASKLRKF